MAAMVNQRADRTHRNSISASDAPISERLAGISARSAVARMDANSLQVGSESRPLREVARDVARELGLSQKAMAINAGVPESDLSNALNGKGRLEIEWLRAQGPDYWTRLMRRVEAEDQTTPEAEDQQEAEYIARLVETLIRRGFRARRLSA